MVASVYNHPSSISIRSKLTSMGVEFCIPYIGDTCHNTSNNVLLCVASRVKRVLKKTYYI